MPVHYVIAHPVDPVNPVEGGAVRFVSNQVKALKLAGAGVTLLGVQHAEFDEPLDEITFVPIIKGKYDANLFIRNLWFRLPFLKLPPEAIIEACRLDMLLPFIVWKPKNPKVLISDEPLYWVRVNWPRFYPLINRIYRAIEHWSLKRIDAVATDKRTAGIFLERYPWAEKKIHTYLTASVDMDVFTPGNKLEARASYDIPQDAFVVLFVGRIARVKRLDLAIEALKVLRAGKPEAILVVAGQGEDGERVRHAATSLPPEAVLFLGEIPPHRVASVLQTADVLILCSVTEGSPLVVKEALACGVPVVSTNVGEVPSVIDAPVLGEIAPETPEGLAQALLRIANDPSSSSTAAIEARVSAIEPSSLKALGQGFVRLAETLRR
jgi:L-malate glycosyltransferase